MTENEAKEWIKYLGNRNLPYDRSPKSRKLACDIAIKALEEIQQYRAIGTVEGYKRAIETSKENYLLYAEYKAKVQGFEVIGTIEEFKALKDEQQNKCKDCAGCTNWKCDCANERDYAITQFANFLHEKSKENNGLRLSSETRSWTHPCIFDYLEEFKNEQTSKAET